MVSNKASGRCAKAQQRKIQYVFKKDKHKFKNRKQLIAVALAQGRKAKAKCMQRKK